MENVGEMMRLCRLCLVKEQVNIPIFEDQGDIRQIFLKISSCLPVKVSREDELPKKICDGCSYKLDVAYELYTTSTNAEKTLLSWLGEKAAGGGVKDDDVKQENVEPSDAHAAVQNAADDDEEDLMKLSSFQQKFSYDEGSSNSAGPSATATSEDPPPKRARRTAAVKAQINLAPESDDDDDMEPMTKMEDESDDSDNDDREPAFVDVPGSSGGATDDQPGPSGVGKDGVEAPVISSPSQENDNSNSKPVKFRCKICFTQFQSRESVMNHLNSKEWLYACSICHAFYKWQVSCTCPQAERKCVYCSDILDEKHITLHLCYHKKTKEAGNEILCDCCNKSFHSEDSMLKHKYNVRFYYKCNACGVYGSAKTQCSCYVRFKICQLCTTPLTQIKDKSTHICFHLIDNENLILQNNRKPPLFNIAGVSNKMPTLILAPRLFLTQPQNISPPAPPDTPKNVPPLTAITSEPVVPVPLTNQLKLLNKKPKEKEACKICGKMVYNMRQHNYMHMTDKPYVCKNCKKSFLTNEELQSHIQEEKEKALPRNYACDQCSKSFTTGFGLRMHTRTAHEKYSKYEKCLVCEKACSPWTVRKHYKVKHRMRYPGKQVRMNQEGIMQEDEVLKDAMMNQEVLQEM